MKQNKNISRVTSLLLVGLLLFSCIPCASASYFSDVTKSLGTEAFDSIMYVADNVLMVGMDDGTFSPSTNVTRAQFVQLLYRHAGDIRTYSNPGFEDVSSNQWFYNAVCWAYGNDIVTGTTDTTFSPDDPLMIQQAIVILKRYAENCFWNMVFDYESGLINSHSDYNTITDYAKDAMDWALAYRIIKPASTSAALTPLASATRKEVAMYFCRFEKEAVGFEDEKLLGFKNEGTAFFESGSGTYDISTYEKNRLVSAINSYYGPTSTTATTLISEINSAINSEWVGACHGMSTVVLYDALGKIDFNANVGSGYDNMSEVVSPKNNTRVRSGIHFYQLASPVFRATRSNYSKDNGNLNTGLSALKSCLKSQGPVV